MQISGNFFINLMDPSEIFWDIKAKNLGLSPIAYAVGASATVVSFLKVMPELEMLNFVFAAMSGSIGVCPGTFPICIEYTAGYLLEAKIVWLGLVCQFKVKIDFPPDNIPDLVLSFKLKIPNIVEMFFGLLKKVLPFAADFIDKAIAVIQLFAKKIGIFPLFQVDNLELVEFSAKGFIMGASPLHVKWNFWTFGKQWGGPCTLGPPWGVKTVEGIKQNGTKTEPCGEFIFWFTLIKDIFNVKSIIDGLLVNDNTIDQGRSVLLRK